MKCSMQQKRVAPRSAELLEPRLLFSTYTVTSLSDADGIVTPAGSGNFHATTLRAALVATNVHAGADTIKFATGLKGTISLDRQLPAINDRLTIKGPGHENLAVRRSTMATTDFSVFHVNVGRGAVISELKIYAGTGDPNSDGIRSGGDIFNAGALTLISCTISGGNARIGGGLYNSGTLKVQTSTVSNNSSDFFGGGVFNNKSVTVINSYFANNFVTANSASGGGLYSNGGTTNVTGCTFSHNGANVGGGGALYCYGTTDITDCEVDTNFAVDGGGIVNAGAMSITRTRLAANHSTSSGGGIANFNQLTVRQSELTGNTCAGLGGGIFTGFGTASVRDSEISAGFAGDGGAIYINSGAILNLSRTQILANVADFGGGVFNNSPNVEQNFADCTFGGNSSFNDGGAIYNSDNGTSIVMSRSTLEGNQAVFGGGIFNGGALNLSNCTIALNDADSNDNAGNGAGGAISSFGDVTLTNCTISGNHARFTGGGLNVIGSVLLNNTIVDGNFLSADSFSTKAEIDGTVSASSSFNIIGTNGRGGLTNGVNGNKVGVSMSALKLGPLHANGGFTETMALLSGSVAINAGSDAIANAAGLTTDQRGVNFPRIRNGHVDIGAFEVQ